MSDDIKAGKYELVALSWDEPLPTKPGEPYRFKRHEQGDIVELNAEEAQRLYSAGAVVKPGERERAHAELLRAQYEAALAALPPEPKPARQSAPPKEIGDFPLDAVPDVQNAWVADANVAQVKAEAEKSPEVKAALLAAELRRGEAARKTLVDALSDQPPA